MKAFLTQQRAWLWPVIILAIITPFTPAIDLAITRHFYRPPHGFASNGFYSFMYSYATLPAILTFCLSMVLLLMSYLRPYYKKWRRPALTLCLTFAIGAGLITHVLLKDQWGRPRPKQTIEFGGTQPFRPYYEPNFLHQPEPSKSFACGHCTMGFYFFALALVGRRLNLQALFWTSLCVAIVLGGLLSLTRIAQGGHYFSDTLMTALIMWLTAYAVDRWVYADAENDQDHGGELS